MFKATRLMLVFSIGLLTIACSPSCQSNDADTEITGKEATLQKVKNRKSTSWILLSSGLTLLIAGVIGYTKGAFYGLTEDYDGGPVIIKNRILTAGKIMMIAGIAGFVAYILLFL